jgi:methyl-accepting chemotaxis protein
MMSLFSDRYKLSLLLSALFILGTGLSLYSIYSLPHGLRLADGYQPAFTPVYLTVGGTFLLGAITLWAAMRYRKELIVFRDRKLESDADKQHQNQEGKTTITLDSVASAIASSPDEQSLWEQGLKAVGKQLEVGQGALYRLLNNNGQRVVELTCGYALSIGESTVIQYEVGEGLIGQAAASGSTLLVDDIPEGYIKIISGLGSASPRFILIVPIKLKEKVLGIIELASFQSFTEDQRRYVEEAAALLAEKISNNG